jgi:hypothetical protein
MVVEDLPTMPERHRPEGDHHPSTSTTPGTTSLEPFSHRVDIDAEQLACRLSVRPAVPRLVNPPHGSVELVAIRDLEVLEATVRHRPESDVVQDDQVTSNRLSGRLRVVFAVATHDAVHPVEASDREALVEAVQDLALAAAIGSQHEVVPSIRKVSRRGICILEAVEGASRGLQWTSPLGDQVVDGDEAFPSASGAE